MPKDWYDAIRLPIAALLIGTTLAFSATADAGTANLTARARRSLHVLGYRQLHLSCARRGRCTWRGVRAGRSCTGVIRAVRRRSGRLRVSGVRCRPPAPLTSPPLVLGFNTYTTPTTVAKQRAVGATITRLFINWWQVESQPGTFDWSTLDRRYQEILKGGLRPLLVPYGAPCWAQDNSGCSLLYARPPSPNHDGDWSALVRAAAMRYPRAVGVEVWNEPNLASEFYPRPDPQRYTQLLREAYTAVRSVNNSMPVISGGLAMNDATGAAVVGYASRTFLADMYADGARRWMDGVGIHVYPKDVQSDGQLVWDPAAMSRWLAQVEDVGGAAGVRGMPIWVTEMGVSTKTEHGFPAAATPDQQARDLLAMVQFARSDPNVRAAIIDSLQDAGWNPAEDTVSDVTGGLINDDIFFNQVAEGLGIFETDWTPKPAACAVSQAFGGSLTC